VQAPTILPWQGLLDREDAVVVRRFGVEHDAPRVIDRASRVACRADMGQRMKRRTLLAFAAGAALAPRWLLAQGARVPRIGYLLLTPVTEPPSRERQAFLDGLRSFGHVPGKTVELIYRSAEGEVEFMDATCQDLLAQKPDVIAVSGALAALAAKRATRTIPIVMLALGDPVGAGAVPSLARPGGNVTGVSFISSELVPKRLQLVRQCVPMARRMAIVWDRRNANSRAEWRAVLDGAKVAGLTAESFGLASDDELPGAFGRIAAGKPDLLYVTFDGSIAAANRTLIAEFGLKQRLPIVSGWSFLTEAGGLLSYAPDIPAMFRRAAYYVDRVLKGASPAELPIEMPTVVELTVNLRTARAIGVTVPNELLARADRVFE
jgi:putative ABC transport system substrate-binding protein